MNSLQWIIVLAMVLQGCNAQTIQGNDCGTFDLKQLDSDLKSEYFDNAGIEMAKAVIVRLKLQLECERLKNITYTGDI